MKAIRSPLFLASIVFLVLDVAAFYCGLYVRMMDPASSTAAFDDAVRSLKRYRSDPRREVLVFGDSRIYAGLDPAIASKAAGGFRFLNGGMPGASPRVWYFLDRAIDPEATRFRAIVIPIDSLTDDTSAVGSLDASEHASDLRYFLFTLSPLETDAVAESLDRPDLRLDVTMDLLLRGPIIRSDLQAFLDDPVARIDAVRARRVERYDPDASHPFSSTLDGLRVDFRRSAIAYPASVEGPERASIADQLLRRPIASASYATYRSRWLTPLVRHYVAAGVPVIFVRIPTRPAHGAVDTTPAGTIRTLVDSEGARLLAPAAYVALERPELFADHDHLSASGARRFSALLGNDVGALLRRLGAARAHPVPMPPFRIENGPSGGGAFDGLASAVRFGEPIRFQSVGYALFLAAVFAAVAIADRRLRVPLLLAASLYFYARWNAWFVAMILFVTVADYALARAIAARPKSARAALAVGIAINLGFLGTIKYANFASATVRAALGLHTDPWVIRVLVPIGISFHTFQSISYLVDVYRDRTLVEKRLDRYALYIAFFPQLLAGPIVRARRFFGELAAWRRPDGARVQAGIFEIAIGLFKKTCVADRFARYPDLYFAAPSRYPGASAAWAAALSFAVQIYFDFSGYTDIAIGSARILGFDFPVNFERPYLAVGIRDFWRRWNITLSTWLRDYLYIPLGGSRHGRLRTYRNLMTTMLLGGLWHGASWTFVAWGGYQGALLCVEHRLGTRSTPRLDAARIVRTACTFALVVVGWVVFRASSFGDAAYAWSQMFSFRGSLRVPTLWPLALVAALVVAEVALEFRPSVVASLERRPIWRTLVLVSLFASLELLSWNGAAAPFVYFKF